MAKLNVNPTRQEIQRLKARLKTAVRGHKLLKDKTDETIRRFMGFVRENLRLRKEIESEMPLILKSFLLASAVNGREKVEEAVMLPSQTVSLITREKNIMGVTVPEFEIAASSETDIFPYSFASISYELDLAASSLNKLLQKLVRLAEVEKTANMLADEIEKSRRRVNALEYILIPDLNETIKYITMKLSENERGATVRLMKVKDIIRKE
ncbi:MAG: V-type ATP synthase subunit D [Christensenellaceae bacterium]|jgi:V/A-type H+-transporting ATPase subunit D|nr:V-type ATP synthase subunit D [Christensenellaceae bacterium]